MVFFSRRAELARRLAHGVPGVHDAPDKLGRLVITTRIYAISDKSGTSGTSSTSGTSGASVTSGASGASGPAGASATSDASGP